MPTLRPRMPLSPKRSCHHSCYSACNFDPLSRGIGVQN
jgi:hypothetical protein